MANPAGIPPYSSRFLKDDGTLTEVWYRYLRRLGVDLVDLSAEVAGKATAGVQTGLAGVPPHTHTQA